MSTAVAARSNKDSSVVRHEDTPHHDDTTMYLTQVHPAVVKVKERFAHHDGVHQHATPVAMERWLTLQLFSEQSKQYVACLTEGMSTAQVAKDMADAKFHAEELRSVIT